MKKDEEGGFTLVELLVVIAIISITSSIALASLGEARARARDAQRIQTLQSIGQALELYYTDHSYYPAVGATEDDATAVDAAWFGSCFGQNVTSKDPCYAADYDNSGVVNFGDLAVHASGDGTSCYTYFPRGSNGACTSGAGLSIIYDNSASPGFLNILETEGTLGSGEWNDPLRPDYDDGGHRLKYNCRYVVDANENSAGNVEKYALYCRVEKQSDASTYDGGKNPMLFEIQKPSPWFCAVENGTQNAVCP